MTGLEIAGKKIAFLPAGGYNAGKQDISHPSETGGKNMKWKKFGALCTTLALSFSLTAVPAEAASFTDVPSTYWGYEDITKMSNLGYAKGYEDGTYKPDGKMTAAETLLFCARATGIDSTTQQRIAEDRAEEMEEILPESMVSWAAKEMAVAV